MRLSNEELQFIDTYLENSSINYIDIRLELTDHIATTIEHELEENSEQTFYELFKSYMLRHKKHLMENYEIQKAKLKNKIIHQFVKNFTSFEVVLLFIISILLMTKFDIISYQEHFLKVNFGICILAVISYYIVFFKTRKTSVGGSLLQLIAICYYIIIYIKNPLDLLYLIPVSVLGYKLIKKVKHRNSIWPIIYVVLFGLVVLPIFIWFDSWSQQFVTNGIILGYFSLQMIMWYVLFKTLLNYKLELERKFKSIFTQP